MSTGSSVIESPARITKAASYLEVWKLEDNVINGCDLVARRIQPLQRHGDRIMKK